jgi:hypothetical protein
MICFGGRAWQMRSKSGVTPMPVEGTVLGNELQGGDEPMDVNVSEEEDLDDDIIEGCYFLEIGIKRFPYPRILNVQITYEFITLSRIIIKSLITPIWHQPSSLQANQESGSPDVPLSHVLTYA